MTSNLDDKTPQNTVNQLVHDMVTPLITSKINIELLDKDLKNLLEEIKNTSTTQDIFFYDIKKIESLISVAGVINNNLGAVQKKIRQLSDALAHNTSLHSSAPECSTLASAPHLNLSSFIEINSILLVDDETIHHDIAKKLLSDRYKLYFAKNGVEAIGICKQQTFDLILMDLQMPKMNGVEATESLRKFINNDVVIIGLTSMPIDLKRTELLALGFNDFLEKPLKLNHLQKLLQSYTGHA